MLTIRSLCIVLVLVAAGACRQAGDDAGRDTQSRSQSDTGMADMPGMPGGAAPSGTTQMMADMESQLVRMRDMPSDSMKGMVPRHRQMVANLIAQLDREMRDMNMPADAAWNSALDSLRQDLRVMPELRAQALREMMPAHSSRVRRVIEMHRSMMAKMGH
jgi:hypothetical protein